MADFVKGLIISVITQKCYNEYFDNLNFFDVPCFKHTLSKGLGIGIIAGSILVKVPQILKILASKSAEGINIYAVYLELFAISANISYSFNMKFPFSAWGDGAFLAIQTAVIGALVLHYSGATAKATVFLGAYAAILSVLMSGATPVEVLWSMQTLTVPIVIAAKSIQIITNYKNGSTGQLSAVTCSLLFGGSLARIFTSIQETGDTVIILTYIVATLTNGILIAQLLLYWNVKSKKIEHKKKAK